MTPSHWTEHDLIVEGVSLHYYRTGDGGKPPLVLQHGFSDDGLCWLQTALDLEEQYDIVMPDARGHGRSDRIQAGRRVDMAADLAGIIQILGLQDPIIGGHSMGATIAFQLGVRYPEVPRALLLEDPPWFQPGPSMPTKEPAEHPLAAWVETINRLTLAELTSETRREHPTWPEWVIQTWCPAKKQMDPNILSILNFEGASWLEGVPLLACPTWLITADPEKGGLVTPAVAARARELNQRCTVVHIPGTGHHIRFEDYDAYMKCIHTFLQDIE